MQFSPEVLAKALKNIYKGFDIKKKIEENIFWETLRLFNEAAAKGFSESEWDDTPDEFINQVRTNNKVWSAFRTHRMQNDLAAKLLDENGQLKKFDKWVEDIKGMTNHYVGSWLRTEYNTAVIRAHQAADWKHFEQEADVFPNLRWMPTTSPLQDPMHRQYWEAKLTLPINHPFWEDHHPGDRWNCKCTLKQTDEPVNDYVIKDFYPVAPQAGLDNNPGVDGKLFNDTHPYFKSDCKVCPFYSSKISNIFENSIRRSSCYNCRNASEEIKTFSESPQRHRSHNHNLKGKWPRVPIKKLLVGDGQNEVLNKAVLKVESKIRHRKNYEEVVVFNQKGDIIFRKKGKKNKVTFSNDEASSFKDKILTHNHHSGWDSKKDSLERIGNSFSIEDLKLAINANLAEIRVVTPTYTFRIQRPKGGWGISNNEFLKIYDDVCSDFRVELFALENQKRCYQLYTIQQHIIVKRVSKRLGIPYKKAKTR